VSIAKNDAATAQVAPRDLFHALAAKNGWNEFGLVMMRRSAIRRAEASRDAGA
jgi:hypothetical protein